MINADGVYLVDMQNLEQWLMRLSEEDFKTICTGEYSEREKIEESCPRCCVDSSIPVAKILDDLFMGEVV